MSRKKQTKSRKKYWLIPVAIIFSLVVYIGITLYFQLRQEDETKFLLYPGFGIEIPTGYSIHGIDVSAYQQYIFWPSVKNMKEENVRLSFVFIKATEGLLNTDKQFRRNWLKSQEAGITRGAYHFFLATKDGKAQALNFIKNVKLSKGDLPPVLDIEELYGVRPETMRNRVKDFLNKVEETYKVKPIIYTNASFYNHYLGEAFNEYPLWVAHYFEKANPSVNRDWLFWQHNSMGKVNGIKSVTDFNVFKGDSSDFAGLLIK
ncbi:MAG TPA: GH25 family lysozyme [Panacibacter sp.]|nr:GH25 family lysozyme [Panacibacter sp.]HNP44823.1 GH25 family lysozyme [Panacibacter sp.]